MRDEGPKMQQQQQQQERSSVVRICQTGIVVPSRAPAACSNPYFLSNLDQNLAVVMQTVYFYKAGPGRSSKDAAAAAATQIIREALAEVLVWYYPLAGRLRVSEHGKLEVCCDKLEVPFVEADAEVTLEQFAQASNLGQGLEANLTQFVATVPDARSVLDIPPLLVQVTKFSCGGIVLGLSTSHALMDGVGAMEFINSWTEVARGVQLSVPPLLDRSMLKARQPLQVEYSHPEFLDANPVAKDTEAVAATGAAATGAAAAAAADYRHKLVFKSILFDEEWLSAVRESVVSGEGVLDRCSCFEAFSAIVWKCRTLALSSCCCSSEKQLNEQKSEKLLFAVDIRSKLQPALPKGYFGNGILLTCATASKQQVMEGSLSQLVQLIRGAITKLGDSYIRSVIDFYEQSRLRPSLESTLVISTWSRLAFHTTDFGFGTPFFTAPASLPEEEVALFLPSGRGFNLVLGLPAPAMHRFVELMEENRERLIKLRAA